FLGGNLWSKPDGSGYSDNCTDADGDALCDVPYFLRVGNTDHLPLVGNLYSACGLSDVLESMDLPHGIANSLLAKAKNLCAAYEKGNLKAAAGMLGAFIAEAEAQRGKKLTGADAGKLIAYAEGVAAKLEDEMP
ncbi:MAG: hypothetical protein HOC91_07675, partial [Nitrospinaceae bacterium]|nr:hypothetical protein [Nitrospinaceae bacterium]